MTALQQFQRLESTGLWREGAEAQRREVAVSFGNATLVISDTAGRALAHWSLPAVVAVEAGDDATIYAPDVDATETLEISDTTMVDAIETVRKALQRQRPKPGRLRAISRLAIIAGVVGLAVFWLPGALREQTLAVVTQTKRAEIGSTILGHMPRACRSTQGNAALSQLHARLFGADAAGRIVVLPSETGQAHVLPGGVSVIDDAVLRFADDPAVIAGVLVAAQATTAAQDPMDLVLDYAGLRQTMRLLTTGDLPRDVLAGYAAEVVESTTPSADLETLVAAFDAADVASGPYALHVGNDALAAADPVADRAVPIILTDGAWVALQGICDS